MSKLWNQVKDTAAIGVQFVKEKTGASSTEVDPVFQAASEKFDIIQERVIKFITDIEEILKVVPRVCEAGLNFSSGLITADQQSGGYVSSVASAFDTFFKAVDALSKDQLISPSNEIVMKNLKALRQQIIDLDKLRAKRRKNQLLVDSLSQKVASLSKKTNSADELAKTRIRYEAKQQKLVQRTQTFVQQVEDLWVRRFAIIEAPLQDFVGIIFLYAQNMFSDLQNLQKTVTPQELQTAFPA